jgi:sulfotransferase family protein
MRETGEVKDRTAAATAPKQGIVWIASFPKSGNTWVRTFLHNLVKIQSGDGEPQNINEMNRFNAWDLDQNMYAGLLGYVPNNNQRTQIAATRHKVHELIADAADGVVFVKTHHALMMDRGYSTINFAVTSGAVYVVRNPLDVAISYAHHMGRSIDFAIEEMAAENVETDVTESRVYEVYSTWSQHVDSWTRKPHPALYVIRYEDMLVSPYQAFDALTRHLLLQSRPEQIALAIERSSFNKLKEQEEKYGFRERSEVADKPFFREGRAGQWREVLTPHQIQRIIRDHREQMRRFGYLKDDGTPG